MADATTQPLPSYSAPQVPPGLPPGAVMTGPSTYVVYGPTGQVVGGGNLGASAPGYQAPPPTGQNAANNPYAYTGNNLNTPYSQRFSYPGVPGLSPGPLGGENGNGQGMTGPATPYHGAPTDQGAIRAWFATQTSDPDYWTARAMEKGGINDAGGYWQDLMRSTGTGGGGAGGVGAGLSYSGMMAGMPGFNAPQFGGYNFAPAGGINAPTPYSAPQDFSYGTYTQPADFKADTFGYNQGVPPDTLTNEKFVAPNLDETNDPGYKFRLQQIEQAIQNNASKQGARGGDVLKAIEENAQNYASSEYGNVYSRAFGQFTEQQQRQMALYNQQLAAQQQGYSQAYNTSSLNSQNAMAAAALNDQNALSAYQTNFNAQDLMHQQNFENAFNVYNGNWQNQLAAAQLNSSNQNQANALGWQVASGSFDRNYESALAQYQLPFQQAMQLANYNLGAQGQGFSQALQGYTTNYNGYTGTQGSQFNNLYNLANMGANASTSVNNAGSNLGNQQTNLLTGAGNANAAGAVARGTANSNLVTGLTNGINTGLTAYSPLNPYYNPRTPLQNPYSLTSPPSSGSSNIPGVGPTTPYYF